MPKDLRLVRVLRTAMLVSAGLCFAGCQTPGLMAAPNLYAAANTDPFRDVPAPLQTNVAEVIYATDRLPLDPPGPIGLDYGYFRAPALTVGVSRVAFGDETIAWPALTAESLSASRTLDLTPRVVENVERLQFPASSLYALARSGASEDRILLEAARDASHETLHQLIAEQSAHARRKEAYVFVHGYDVPFYEAVTTIAQIWHFMGRDGVPIAYTWPAGRGGIRGYTTDRESGEYTIFHLKNFLEALAKSPDIRRVNIIAHSRGTDVVMTALRELHIHYRAAGDDTREALKLGAVVLAAPDLDLQVVTQRISAEGTPNVPERLTIYIFAEDRAIGLAGWLFDSVTRLGRLSPSALTDEERERLAGNDQLEIVDARITRPDFIGHSYFFRSPAVASDLMLVLREHRPAGAQFGRPLGRDEGFWIIDDAYPTYTYESEEPSP